MGTEIQRIWVTERIVCKALAAAYGQSCLRNQKEKHPIGCFFFFIEFVVEPTTEAPKGQNATASGGRNRERCCRKKHRGSQGDLSTK